MPGGRATSGGELCPGWWGRAATTIALDKELSPLAVAAGSHPNEQWGLLMRTGNDKSLMARHVERHADVYTSRVSNFLNETPHAYLRSARGSLPHDPIADHLRPDGEQ